MIAADYARDAIAGERRRRRRSALRIARHWAVLRAACYWRRHGATIRRRAIYAAAGLAFALFIVAAMSLTVFVTP